jgi:hypothetical protein
MTNDERSSNDKSRKDCSAGRWKLPASVCEFGHSSFGLHSSFVIRHSSFVIALALLTSSLSSQAQNVILHLKNGDRLAGYIVSEDTNRVVLTNSWIQQLAVPLAQIERREAVAPPVAPAKAAPPVTPAPTNQPPTAPTVAAPPTPPKTNAQVAAKPLPPAKPPAPKPKYLTGNARVGMDFLHGAKDQENYYAALNLTYARPYPSNPKHFFRNIFDYRLDYGRTEGVETANRMEGRNKTDFDVGTGKMYVYNLGVVGYDQVRKIDLYYELGPGAGYHLLAKSNIFVLNTEAGLDYQAQNRSDNTSLDHFYYRFGEDLTWRPLPKVTLTQKAEFLPQLDISQYRARVEATLSYGFWQRLTLNLNVLDLYDTQPAAGVPNNDLQVRSSIGITF